MHENVRRFIDNVVLEHYSYECLPWPFYRNEHGYGRFKHNGAKVIASRFICELVNGPPANPKDEAAHSCGNGHEGCVNAWHLSWKSMRDNQLDRKHHGTSNAGVRNGRALLSADDIQYIRNMRGVLTQPELGVLFGVSPRTICGVQLRETWGDVPN